MTRRDDAHRDRADELDRAIDALMRGDHSGLDDLPSELASTVDRLFWLSAESGQEHASVEATTRPERDSMARETPVVRSVSDETSVRPLVTPMSNRTRKESVAAPLADEDVAEAQGAPRRNQWPSFMRMAAVLVMLLVAGGGIYALVPMLDDPGPGQHGSPLPDVLHLQRLEPERCAVEPKDRAYALEMLQSVDVHRDEALRQRVLIRPVEQDSVPLDRLTNMFVMWQSCRRFGFTYEAMSLQTPYYLRRDFYGENTLDFRGPVETAYSDATLNEMLDRREELDATSRQYWEHAGYYPDPTLTLILGGETFANEDRTFIAVRAMTFDVQSETWRETTTVVIFHLIDGEPFLFDIQSTPIGTPPYL